MQEKITVLPDDSYEGMEPIIVENNEIFFSLTKGETTVSIHDEEFYNFLDSLLSIVSLAEGSAYATAEQVTRIKMMKAD